MSYLEILFEVTKKQSFFANQKSYSIEVSQIQSQNTAKFFYIAFIVQNKVFI